MAMNHVLSFDHGTYVFFFFSGSILPSKTGETIDDLNSHGEFNLPSEMGIDNGNECVWKMVSNLLYPKMAIFT